MADEAKTTHPDDLEELAETYPTAAAEIVRQRAALEALRDLDHALSDLWSEGPVDPGHPNYLGKVDEAWKVARAVLQENSDAR